MAFKPNIRGPFCNCGEITVAAAGTAIPLSQNWSPDYNPMTPTTPGGGSIPEYAIRWEDLIINSPAANGGGLYLVTYNIAGATGSKNSTDTIILYIPKGSIPISVKHYLGLSKINPNQLAIDADTNGDKCWAVGIVG